MSFALRAARQWGGRIIRAAPATHRRPDYELFAALFAGARVAKCENGEAPVRLLLARRCGSPLRTRPNARVHRHGASPLFHIIIRYISLMLDYIEVGDMCENVVIGEKYSMRRSRSRTRKRLPPPPPATLPLARATSSSNWQVRARASISRVC